jgi:serine/threonine protein kinase
MKRRHSINKSPGESQAMPIPGRMKLNVSNKRLHYAPPSPQVQVGLALPFGARVSPQGSGSSSGNEKHSLLANSDKDPARATSLNNSGGSSIQTSPMRFVERRRAKELSGQGHNDRAQGQGRVGLSDFERIHVLGKGAFGKVLLVRNKLTKEVYAMKILKKDHVINKRQVAHTMSERNVLGHTKHPFVVGMHYAFQTVDKLIFVLDYCAGGDLYYHISRGGPLSEERCKFYAAELAEALAHLHARGVVYRDLKPENVMMDAGGHVKLVDFGLSKQNVRSAVEGASSYCGTPEYLAPEVMTDPAKRNYGTAIDWWSLGALMYEMLTGLPPWYSRDREKLFNGIKHGELTFPAFVSVPARAILTHFLCRDPFKRLGVQGGIDQIRKYPFFHDLDWKKLVAKELIPPWLPSSKAEDVEQMSTLYFDKVFTRLPVQSEAVPHRPEGDSAVSQEIDGHGVFSGFSYISRKMMYTNSNSLSPPRTGLKMSPGSSPPATFLDPFGNNLNDFESTGFSLDGETGSLATPVETMHPNSLNPYAQSWDPRIHQEEGGGQERMMNVALALDSMPEGQKSLSSLATAWDDGADDIFNRRESDEMFDLDDMSL